MPKGGVAARGAVEALRAGRHLALLVDQKMNDGIAVPFFGRLAMTCTCVMARPRWLAAIEKLEMPGASKEWPDGSAQR